MSLELIHASVGQELSRPEWESVNAHILVGGSAGSVLYYDGASIKGLAPGAAGTILSSTGSALAWESPSAITISPLVADLDANNHLITNIGNAGTDFTTGGGLNLAGVLVLANRLVINNTAIAERGIRYQTGGLDRWLVGMDGVAETGSNTGSNIIWNRYNDAGAAIDTPMGIRRADGLVNITTNLIVTGQVASATLVGTLNTAAQPNITSTGTLIGLTTSGNITFTGASPRVLADMTTLTRVNRLHFQTSVANSPTFFGILPSGSSTDSRFTANNTSNPDIAGRIYLFAGTASAGLTTDITGAGVEPPLITISATTPGTILSISTATGVATFNYATTSIGILTSKGNIGLDGTVAGNTRYILWSTSAVPRWSLGTNNTAETGGNTGSNFQLVSATDAGTTLGVPISVDRASGAVTLGFGAFVSGALTVTGGVSFNSAVDMHNQIISNIGNAGTDFLANGGLTLANALTVTTGGIAATGNSTIIGTLGGVTTLSVTTVTATNLGGTISTAAQPNITSVGILAAPHMTSPVVDSGGLIITLGGATITGSSTFNDTVAMNAALTALSVSAGIGGLTGTLNTPAQPNITSVGILVAPHMTSPVVNSGGLTVTLGGATITGNSTITGTLNVTGVVTAASFSGGITITGALDMTNNIISNIGNAGTDFLSNGGLTLANALTVTLGGITATGNSLITGTLSTTDNIIAGTTTGPSIRVNLNAAAANAATIGIQSAGADIWYLQRIAATNDFRFYNQVTGSAALTIANATNNVTLGANLIVAGTITGVTNLTLTGMVTGTTTTTFGSNNGTARWIIDASGNFISSGNNAYDIGDSANIARPKNLYLAGTATMARLGIGIASATNAYLLIQGGPQTSGVTQNGLAVNGQYGSDATSGMFAMQAGIQAQAGSYNTANIYTYLANTPVLGTGQTVGTYVGLQFALQTLPVATVTNAYGINLSAPANAITTNIALQITGATPTSVATTPGMAGAVVISATGSTGGNTTIATTGIGGIGGGYVFIGGVGGQATAAVTASTGGVGGGWSMTMGAGGAASVVGAGTGTGGVGGATTFTTGAGGAASTSTGVNLGGNGGAFSFTTGNGGAATNGSTSTGGISGGINFITGSGGAGTTIGGVSGNIVFQTGAPGAGGAPAAGGIYFRTNGVNTRLTIADTSITAAVTLNLTTGLSTSVGANIAIGSAIVPDFAFYITGANTSSGVNQYGVLSQNTFGTAATSSVSAITGKITITAAMTSAIGRVLQAQSPSLGASSLITTNQGLYVNNQGHANVANAYGVYIEAQANATTTNIGLYNAGTTTLVGNVTTSGVVLHADGSAAAPSIAFASAPNSGIFSSGGGLTFMYLGTIFFSANGAAEMRMSSGVGLGWTAGVANATANDLVLARDAADTLAQRRLANAQKFKLYNTIDAGLTNYERLAFIAVTGANFQIIPEAGGTGVLRGLTIGGPVLVTGVSAPASVATTTGTAATGVFSTTGTPGGVTTIATTGFGGAGSSLTFTTGIGGQATLAATAGTGGSGGIFSITTGAGAASAVVGAGTGTGGTGGSINFTTGVGGAVTTSTGVNTGGASGFLQLLTGNGGNASAGSSNLGGNSGYINIITGPGGTGTIGGSSGDITLRTGTPGGGVAGPGSIYLQTNGTNNRLVITDNGINSTTGTVLSGGDLAFTSLGQRITADFSTVTLANRVAFQSSVVNGNTIVGILPNGTSTTTSLALHNTNIAGTAGRFAITLTGSAVSIVTSISGAGVEPTSITIGSILGAIVSINTATGAVSLNYAVSITSGGLTLPGGTLLTTSAALTNGAAAALATLTNAPVAGNPTKWIPINDNGTTRYMPAW